MQTYKSRGDRKIWLGGSSVGSTYPPSGTSWASLAQRTQMGYDAESYGRGECFDADHGGRGSFGQQQLGSLDQAHHDPPRLPDGMASRSLRASSIPAELSLF